MSAAGFAEVLAPFGVRVGARLSISCTVYRAEDGSLVKAVGEVLRRADGSVVVCPRRDSTDLEVVSLLRAGELACREEPSEASGWEPRRTARAGEWWQHTLLLTADSSDPYSAAYRAVVNPMEVVERECSVLGPS